jgi:hypothetical protein
MRHNGLNIIRFPRTDLKTSFATACAAPILLALCPLAGMGQQPKAQTLKKMPPASLISEAYVLDDSVVTKQWPQTLPKVNAPSIVSDLSPGQCIRVAAMASGEDSATFFKQPQIGFTVHFAGHDTDLPPAPVVAFKQLKPEGSDFVQAALNAGGVKYEVPSSAAMVASPDKWCVPADAAAGKVKIDAVVINGEKRTSLKAVTLAVIAPESPGPFPFKDDTAVEAWSQTYYRHPQPEYLISVVKLIFSHDASANILQQSVISAMKRDPAVVSRLGPQLATAEPQVQAMMVKLASEAGVEMKIPFALSPMQKEFVEKLPNIPDAFHPVADIHIGEIQDMLWSMFTATGDRAPVDSIIGMLAWRSDYDAFMKMQAEHQKITEVTPSIAHAVAYGAAGWSLGSFQRTDPLVADYIAATLADAKTPESIKKELRELDTNPAFKRK